MILKSLFFFFSSALLSLVYFHVSFFFCCRTNLLLLFSPIKQIERAKQTNVRQQRKKAESPADPGVSDPFLCSPIRKNTVCLQTSVIRSSFESTRVSLLLHTPAQRAIQGQIERTTPRYTPGGDGINEVAERTSPYSTGAHVSVEPPLSLLAPCCAAPTLASRSLQPLAKLPQDPSTSHLVLHVERLPLQRNSGVEAHFYAYPYVAIPPSRLGSSFRNPQQTTGGRASPSC